MPHAEARNYNTPLGSRTALVLANQRAV